MMSNFELYTVFFQIAQSGNGIKAALAPLLVYLFELLGGGVSIIESMDSTATFFGVLPKISLQSIMYTRYLSATKISLVIQHSILQRVSSYSHQRMLGNSEKNRLLSKLFRKRNGGHEKCNQF